MVKKYTIAIFLLVLSFVATAPSHAQRIADSSATVETAVYMSNSRIQTSEIAIKRKTIYELLKKYNSPLVNEVDSFIEACITYELDCYLLPSIAGVESTFGKFLMPGTHNPFGWGRGLIAFDSYHDSIMAVGKGLRNNYINKGASTIEEIGVIYCEGNTWAGKVSYFDRQFKLEEEKQLYFMHDPVQL